MVVMRSEKQLVLVRISGVLGLVSAAVSGVYLGVCVFRFIWLCFDVCLSVCFRVYVGVYFGDYWRTDVWVFRVYRGGHF